VKVNIKFNKTMCLLLWVAGTFFLPAFAQVQPDTSRRSLYRYWEHSIKDPDVKIQLYTRAIDSLEDDWARYYRGQAYLERGRFTLAENDFWGALKYPKRTLHPAWPYVRLAEKFYQTGDYKMAIRMSDKSLEFNDSLAMAWRIRARSLLKSGNIEGAFQDLAKAIQFDSDNPENIWERSGISLAREDYNACLTDVQFLLKYDQGNTQYLTRNAWCLYQLGQVNESSQLLVKLKGQTLSDPEANSALGDLMYMHDELEEAERLYSQAIYYYDHQIIMDAAYGKKNRDVVYEVYISRGLVRQETGKRREALNDFTRASMIYPGNYRTYIHIGELQTYQANYQDAITAYDQAMRLNPGMKEGWLNLGFCYSQLGRYKEAIHIFNKGIAIDTSNCMLYNNRGFTYLILRQMNKALGDLKTAMQMCPEEMMPLVSMGEYYILLEQYDQAIVYLNQGLALPDGSDGAKVSGYHARGKAWLHKRELTKAFQDIETAALLDSGNAEIWESLGITAYRMEKFCDALRYFQQALSLDVRNDPHKAPHAAYYIGIIHQIVVRGCP